MLFKTFGWSFVFTAVGLVAGLLYGGVEGFLSVPVVGRYFLPKTVPHMKAGTGS